MTPEAIAFLGSGTILLVNIVGWVIAFRRNGSAIRVATAESTRATDIKLSVMSSVVNNLPCIRDSDYMVESGRLLQKVEQLDKQQCNIEKQQASTNRKLDKLLLHLGNSDG